MADLKENYCSLFPDKWKFIVDFDISFLCYLHDQMYEAMFPTYTRKDADIILLNGLMRYKPNYHILWALVYRAVRAVGWIPWYMHRFENATGIKRFNLIDKWLVVRNKLESSHAIT